MDSKFVHAISPNVYRTFKEAYDAFKWFETVGEWDKHFNAFERFMIIYLGSTVMFLLGKSLKKKYLLNFLIMKFLKKVKIFSFQDTS